MECIQNQLLLGREIVGRFRQEGIPDGAENTYLTKDLLIFIVNHINYAVLNSFLDSIYTIPKNTGRGVNARRTSKNLSSKDA